MCAYKRLYCAYLLTEELRRMHSAKTLLGFPSLTQVDGPTSITGIDCSVFASLTFCTNSHANSHTGKDIYQDMVILHQPDVAYMHRQDPLAYF